MPIYEFYCDDCHTIYSFFSRRVNTEKRPGCPDCSRSALTRQVSMFSSPRSGDDRADEPPADLDQATGPGRRHRTQAARSRNLTRGTREYSPQYSSARRSCWAASTGASCTEMLPTTPSLSSRPSG